MKNKFKTRRPNIFILLGGVAICLLLSAVFLGMGRETDKEDELAILFEEDRYCTYTETYGSRQQFKEPATNPEDSTYEHVEALSAAFEGSALPDGYAEIPADLMNIDGAHVTPEGPELIGDSLYCVKVKIPDDYLYLTDKSRSYYSVFYYGYDRSSDKRCAPGNHLDVDVHYPAHVEAGETGMIILLVSANKQKLVGTITFEAKDDLNLVNGDGQPASISKVRIVGFSPDGTVELTFFTGATDESARCPHSALGGSCGSVNYNFFTY